jgi:DNA-binding transcriptional ArsR family regulator
MDIFQVLAEPRRRAIVQAVAEEGQLTAGGISRKFNVSKPAISQHLKVLQKAHVLHMEKWGRERIYQVEPKALAEIEKWLKSVSKSFGTEGWIAWAHYLRWNQERLTEEGGQRHDQKDFQRRSAYGSHRFRQSPCGGQKSACGMGELNSACPQ